MLLASIALFRSINSDISIDGGKSSTTADVDITEPTTLSYADTF